MRKLSNFLVFFLVLGVVFGILGCDEDGDGETVSFESYTSYSIKVQNRTNQRLVAFDGELRADKLISGVPANSGEHGLRKASFFNSNREVVLIFITEAQYNSKKSNLGSLEDQVFVRVHAFYNNTGTNNNVFEISSQIGGDGRLNIVNSTPYHVELRDGGTTGPILGYAAGGMTSGNVLRLYVPRDYEIYPIFKFYNQNERELYSVIPKSTEEGPRKNKPWVVPYSFNSQNLIRTFNVSEIESEGLFNFSSGGAIIRINNASMIDIRMWNGTTPMFTSTEGNEYFASGTECNYTIPFTRNSDGTYPPSRLIGSLRVGAVDNMKPLGDLTLELDYIYTINVTGSNVNNLVIGTPQKSEEPLDIKKMFGIDN